MRKVIALDIETTGLSPWKDQILLVGVYDGMQYNCIRHSADLKMYLSGSGQEYDLVCHNAQFDIKFLEVKGWWKPDGRTIHDTKIMASLLPKKVPKDFIKQYETDRKALNKTDKTRKLRKGTPTSLKVLAPYYLQVPRFWESGTWDDMIYNRKDCEYTYALYSLFSSDLQQEETVWAFYETLLKWSEMIRAMEIKGIKISLSEIEKLDRDLEEKSTHELAQLYIQWHDETEEYRQLQAALKEKPIEKIKPFNFGSPKQLTWLLRDKLKLDIKSAEGIETTGKAVLNRLVSENKKEVENLIAYRKTKQLLKLYTKPYQELQHNGLLHTSFNITGTRTGRTSSSGPNLQQVPTSLYQIFHPNKYFKFVKYDLSGIEAALIALYSGDPKLYEIISKGESFHDHNVRALFGINDPLAEIASKYPKERKVVKNIGFACFYGAGWKRISQTFAAGGFPIADKEAKKRLAMLKEYYPKPFEFHKTITETFEAGETIYNLFGRPVTIQPWENPYMQGFNTLIQSSASDLNLAACYKYWKSGGNPLLVIHDCILAEEADTEANGWAHLMEECLTNWNLVSEGKQIKLMVEGGVSSTWEK